MKEVPNLTAEQDVFFELKSPLKATGHLQILFGNLASVGSVAKISGNEGDYFEGRAKVYDDEYNDIDGIQNGEVNSGVDIVFRYLVPHVGPDMHESIN